jgi:hypothetical protein
MDYLKIFEKEKKLSAYGAGVSYNPPCLYVYYINFAGKRRRKMPIRQIIASLKNGKKDAINIDEIVKKLMDDHDDYIRLLQEKQVYNV